MSIPTIGPKSESTPPEKVTNSQAIRVLGFLIIMGTVGIPLTILLWKVALSWTP